MSTEVTVGQDSTTGVNVPIKASVNAMHVHLVTALQGEDATRNVILTLQEVNATTINATGVTVVKASSGAYFGYKILGAAGAFTLNVYDNASAASGQQMEITAGVSVAAALDGRRDTGEIFTNGLTVSMSGDPTDGLVRVYWR